MFITLKVHNFWQLDIISSMLNQFDRYVEGLHNEVLRSILAIESVDNDVKSLFIQRDRGKIK